MNTFEIFEIIEYHKQTDPDSAIVKICEAIEDKEHGLGLLWMSAEFEAWFGELEQYPSNWIIGQHRDYLKIYLQYLTDLLDQNNLI